LSILVGKASYAEKPPLVKKAKIKIEDKDCPEEVR